jgi:nitric oxide reductase NorQ protein
MTGHDGLRAVAAEPYYVPLGDELEVFAACHARGLPVMLKGPTGCGKTRFVEHMAWTGAPATRPTTGASSRSRRRGRW